MTTFLVSVLAASNAVAFTPSKDPNMNGEYFISKTPGAPGDFPTNFKDFPGGVEYFDVYHGPIKSYYSEVWWTNTANDIPQEIVDRFDGKVMAIVGMESDQVRKTPEGDVSVPINMAYNHHHDTAVVGKGTKLVEMEMEDPRIDYSNKKYIRLSRNRAWAPVEHTPSKQGVPTSAMFSTGNGGEYRRSFHAYAPPFAQLVESPNQFAGSPMQIDTWNRDKMNISGGSPFVAGPLPKNSLAPPNAVYSGLLECPLTSRIQKIYDGGNGGFNTTFSAEIFSCSKDELQHACKAAVSTASECFTSAQQLDGLTHAKFTTETVSDDTTPAGCSISVDASGAAPSVVVTFNTNSKSDVCCSSGESDEVGGTAASLVKFGLTVSGSKNLATITMSGPSTVWFGVGFGTTLMADLPYAITVEGNTGNVTERKLGNHDAGSVLAKSVAVQSNTVADGVRTVVLTRALKGATKDHYSFNSTDLTLDFINAIGAGAEFAYHKSSTAASLNLWPTATGQHVCVCMNAALPFGQVSGLIKYLPTGETVGFKAGRCSPEPREDLLVNRNPTCDLRTYAGGLSTCHHGWSLLDAEQEIPWQDTPLVYYKKFRIYFQEYNASFHKQIQRSDWGIAADGDHAEYDVPQCAPGTPVAECNHTIQGTWKPVPGNGTTHIVSAHFHCHAPTCLMMELWNNDTGKLLCREVPMYGGSGKIDERRFDEEGYIAQPPCMWGRAEDGLEAPPLVSDVTIKVVSVTNNTYGHHGEMALPEMGLVNL